jgi:two-component system cell cycle sensor histidine kinase/response regulator CckA
MIKQSTSKAAEHLPHIFEPFFTTKDIGKGTGLGLATVYGIVMQHLGLLEVTTQPGKGTCFHIFLPAAAGAEASETGAAAPMPIAGGSETILLVEDEMPLLIIVKKVLEQAGYTVLTAASGVAARRLWLDHRETIDLLLTDMVMPEGLSGKQLAESLKVQKPDLRVIYMTGYSPELRRDTPGIEEGFNFLQKPFLRPALLQAVRRQLDSRG